MSTFSVDLMPEGKFFTGYKEKYRDKIIIYSRTSFYNIPSQFFKVMIVNEKGCDNKA